MSSTLPLSQIILRLILTNLFFDPAIELPLNSKFLFFYNFYFIIFQIYLFFS